MSLAIPIPSARCWATKPASALAKDCRAGVKAFTAKPRPRPSAKTPAFSAPLRPGGPRLRCAAKAGDFAPTDRRPAAKIANAPRGSGVCKLPRKHRRPPLREPRRSKLRVTLPALPPPPDACSPARHPRSGGEAAARPRTHCSALHGLERSEMARRECCAHARNQLARHRSVNARSCSRCSCCARLLLAVRTPSFGER